MPPVRSFPSLAPTLAGLLLLALPVLGCGDDPGEPADVAARQAPLEISGADAPPARSRDEARAALASARERLAKQATAIDQATDDVERAEAELEAAESRLEVARAAFEAGHKEVDRAAEQMRRFAVPDPVLFRNVQRELLDAASLREVAIAAEVEDGVVTLRGRVPDETLRKAAVALVTDVDGVISVEDRIEVAEAE